MKNNRIKIAAVLSIIFLLALAFWWGGGSPQLKGLGQQPENINIPTPPKDIQPDKAATPPLDTKKDISTPSEKDSGDKVADIKTDDAAKPAIQPAKEPVKEPVKNPPEVKQDPPAMEIDKDTGKDKYQTDPVPQGNPIPIEPQNVKITDKELTCTLSVRCDTINTNIEWLDPEKVELVPKDGVIYAQQTVTFYEGESVFNLLVREMKKNKLHMEFTNTPIYNSAYIEGIGNLYEFDCGELSGWMYKVNGWFPNYGCSRYELKQDDTVEWVYTCDLGVDVGGRNALDGE